MANEQIPKTGVTYDAYSKRWEFYLRSYLGGEDYQGGSYLTPYKLESKEDYDERIVQTPLDNQCKNVIHIYSSFLWRSQPTREFGVLDNDPSLEGYLDDADYDGRSHNAVMREATVWASVYGHCWLILDKPSITSTTRADELAADIRPYLTLVTPENVFDWEYERSPTGKHHLIYLKVRESVKGDEKIFRIWTPEFISLWKVKGDLEPVLLEEAVNPLNLIPAVTVYSQRSSVRGVGVSDIADVADIQRAVYNELSEIEQLIRISNHPSLAKTEGTDASAGAGAIIRMADDLDPGLKPYLLQPSGGNLDAIRASIEDKINSVDRVTHLGAVRATEKAAKSGIALQTEFQMLNSRLSEKADLLELAEEQLWTLWAVWQGREWDGVIDYADSFDLKDYASDLEFLQMARATGVQSVTFKQSIDKQIAALVVDEDDLAQAYEEIEGTPTVLGQFNTQVEVVE